MPEAVPPTVERLACSPVEAGEALGLGETVVRELIARGELPAFRVGRRVLVPVAGLRAWVADRAAEATNGPGAA